MFSYGSGASASLFSFLFYEEEGIEEKFPSFTRRLDERKRLSAASFFHHFDEGCEERGERKGEEKEEGCLLPLKEPEVGFIEPGDWFLKGVDARKRRTYEQFMG